MAIFRGGSSSSSSVLEPLEREVLLGLGVSGEDAVAADAAAVVNGGADGEGGGNDDEDGEDDDEGPMEPTHGPLATGPRDEACMENDGDDVDHHHPNHNEEAVNDDEAQGSASPPCRLSTTTATPRVLETSIPPLSLPPRSCAWSRREAQAAPSLFYITLGSADQRIADGMPAYFLQNPSEAHVSAAYQYWRSNDTPLEHKKIAKRWLLEHMREVDYALKDLEWERMPRAHEHYRAQLALGTLAPAGGGAPPVEAGDAAMDFMLSSSSTFRELNQGVWRIVDNAPGESGRAGILSNRNPGDNNDTGDQHGGDAQAGVEIVIEYDAASAAAAAPEALSS